MYYIVDRGSIKRKLKKNLTLDGFMMKPKMRLRKDFIEVKEIIILDRTLTDNVLKMQFQVAFKRLFKMVMNIMESDDASESDMNLALSEIERTKQVLKDKYAQVISQNEYRRMRRKVTILEKQLREKIIIQQRFREMMWSMMQTRQENLEEKKGRGR